MLLDGGYIRQLDNVMMGFRRADRLDATVVNKTQHVFVAATLPDMGLRSVDAYLQRRFPNAARVSMAGMHNARHYGLHERTQWIADEPATGNKERMINLVEMFQESSDKGGLKGEKVMVFLNSVEDVDGAANALRRAGIDAIPYHAKIRLHERVNNLNRYRQFSVEEGTGDDAKSAPVLVCTDLASRGLDIPGVSVVVQLQFAGNVVAHLHRMGRCGRAGKQNGRGIIFYGEQEEALVELVKQAEKQQDRMVLKQDVEELNEENPSGSVKQAFSRKRGLTKKRKKANKAARDDESNRFAP
mmetsp:Transcript_23457/g.36061  ORF Transcript_23457/g.36061 Transcript_23457/m.36061 type:complete len:300 (+) Transcript_23457:248-1147(+)